MQTFPEGLARSAPGNPYGAQQSETWLANDQSPRPLLDLQPNGELWRIHVTGDLLVEIVWGTSSSRKIQVDAPVIADLPGNVTVTATPRLTTGTTGKVSATQVSGAGPQVLRRFVGTPGATLPEDAESYIAATASVVTIRAIAVNLAAGESVPLVPGSVHTSGQGFIQFQP